MGVSVACHTQLCPKWMTGMMTETLSYGPKGCDLELIKTNEAHQLVLESLLEHVQFGLLHCNLSLQ